jgi:prolyl oligopeptidase
MKTKHALAPLAPLAIGILAGCAAAPPGAPASVIPPAKGTAIVDARDAAPGPVVTRPAWASAYPAARVLATHDILFGTEVRDPYRWLEDEKSPEVQAWMRAEDTLARGRLATLPGRDAIAARLKELVYVDAQSIPVMRGGRMFYSRRSGAQEKWVSYWRAGKQGAEHVLLDPNAWSKDGSVSLHMAVPSWDGKRVAYTVSENNSDESTLHVIDIASGKVSTVDVIPGAKYAKPSWTPAGDGFYYVRVPVDPKIPVDARPGWAELRFHRLGTDPAKDALVHEKTGDPSTFLSGTISRDGHWLLSEVSHGWSTNDVYLRDLRTGPAAASSPWIALVAGKDALYDVNAFRDRFYVSTNEGAPNGRVFVVDATSPARAAWREIVPERRDATLASLHVVGGALSLEYLKDATTRLEIRDLEGKLVRDVPLPGPGSAYPVIGEAEDDEAYYSFESFDHPVEIRSTSVKRGGDALWFTQKVPFDPSPYEVDQIFFTSKDGTRVPMFVVHARSMKKDGQAPLLLTGYGGFNLSETPSFSASLVPWLERGGVYVDVNLRGGGEYGEPWHRGGMRHLKQNVFDDFVAAAETLVREKITSRDRLVIEGGSNGGLLVGAAVTQRPDLFRAAVCGVPLLDMVRYHLFGSGRTWIDEYGSAENEADFKALLAYSPYHHVTAGTAYPSVLFESSDSDDRVDPMHARKMAAALQAASSGGPVLVRIEQHAGHGGADLYRAWVDRVADRYAFLFAEIERPGRAMSAVEQGAR